MSSPGIVVVQDFLMPEQSDYKGYANYMDRPNASAEFSGYLNYMKDGEKSTGLFTADKDALSEDEKGKLKQVMDFAQKNNSPMWIPIISFDNAWLEKNHLYDSKEKYLDEHKLKEYTRAGIDAMLRAEQMENAFWSAAIHYNTDNIHIHVSIVEPVPSRPKMIYENREVYRGKMKYKSIQKCKSTIANRILSQSKENEQINDIIRNSIIQGKRNHCILNDPDLAELFKNIYQSLPKDRSMWKYNMNIMKDIRPEVDQLTKAYLNKYHKKDLESLTKLMTRQQIYYREAYGNSGQPSQYIDNKIKDMYARLGNCILKEMLSYDREVRRLNSGAGVKFDTNEDKNGKMQSQENSGVEFNVNDAKNEGRQESWNRKGFNFNAQNADAKRGNQSNKKAGVKFDTQRASVYGINNYDFRGNGKYRYGVKDMEKIMYDLKKAMNNEFEKFKNEMEYERDYQKEHNFSM